MTAHFKIFDGNPHAVDEEMNKWIKWKSESGHVTVTGQTQSLCFDPNGIPHLAVCLTYTQA
jgi:hypothetical protein